MGAAATIVCVPVQLGGKIAKKVLGTRGRKREVEPNLRVKEVVLGDGERRERYAVCYNPREAKRRRSHRRYGRYLRLTRSGKLRLNRAGVRAAERLDGKFVVHTNDDTLSADDMALGYR